MLSVFCLLPSVFAIGCGGSPDTADRERPPAPPRAPAAKAEAPAAVSNTPRIIFLGDSLTAGLGLSQAESFPALIQKRLQAEGYDYEVVNAGVSGDTSAGGLRRLQFAMEDGRPRILVVALGGNDALRGLPPSQLEKNLAAAIEAGLARGLTVVLAGMEAPPNYGPEYTAAFRQTYVNLARTYDVKLIPFLLDGVAGIPSLNQADGIHPNARGAAMVADLVWKAIEPSLEKPAADLPRPNASEELPRPKAGRGK